MPQIKPFDFMFKLFSLFFLSIFLISCASQSPYKNLDKPLENDAQVLVFANEAAVAANTYNFATYQQTFQTTAQYFTPQGWIAFKNALEQSTNLEMVVRKKLVVSAVATGAPVVINQGVQAGRFVWHVQVPLLVVYQNAKENIKRNVIVNMLIMRVPQTVGTRGLGIQSFIAT